MKKHGRRRGVQRYYCNACAATFQSKRRGTTDEERLWYLYTFRKQTVTELAATIPLSARQIRRKLKKAPKPSVVNSVSKDPIVVVLDTTYFASYGVMVFRDPAARRNLLWYFLPYETNDDYLCGLHELRDQGHTIAAVVCDGKKWLAEAISREYPVQHCQFHLMKTVTRYLTRRPELPAGQELRRIVLSLCRTISTVFTNELKTWHVRWAAFLREKTVDPVTGHWHYTHRRVRGAYAAIRHALPYLFAYENFPTIVIPKTTNTLDGTFSHVKQKIHVHRGLSIETEQKMVSAILATPSTSRKTTRNVH